MRFDLVNRSTGGSVYLDLFHLIKYDVLDTTTITSTVSMADVAFKWFSDAVCYFIAPYYSS